MRLFCRAPAAVLLLAASTAAAAWPWNKYPVPVKDRPDWVEAIAAEPGFTVPRDDIAQGIYHLLVDTQVRVSKGDPEYFYHYARHIVNQAGVEQGAQIHIDYNPAYQSLRLHELAVRRGGEKIDKFDTARMNLISREQELDQLLYSGGKALHVVLDDIVVGDTVEYSYTIEGYNPIYDGIFAFSHYTEWSVPVHRLSLMVHWLRPRPLYFKSSGDVAVRKAPLEDGVRYVVEKTDIAAQAGDENTPHWFDPHGVVRFSESESWQSVADWARPLLESGVSDGPEIRKIAAGIAQATQDSSGRIARALQYVQEEVRYFGIEIGANSHRPSSAEETLARRYGDCKDKTVLLLSILRALGVEAYPALVNSRLNRELREALPALNLFDHVIVTVLYDGGLYWLDPTRQYQYGGLGAIHQPDFGYALVLNPGAVGLTPATPLHQAPSGNVVREIFDLSAGPNAPALYTAHTTVRGLNAEKLRAKLAAGGQSSAQKDYLMFYRRFYPSLETVEPVSFTDRPELNEMEVAEKYSIGAIWNKSAGGNVYARFHANSIMPYLRKVKADNRRHPLALEHPVNISHSIEIRLHDYLWEFEDEDFTEDNFYFAFSRKVRFDAAGKSLLLEFAYASKAGFVPPESVDDYIDAYEAVDRHSRYGILIKPAALAGGSEKKSKQAEPDYSGYVFAGYLLLCALIFAAWRSRRKRHLFTGPALYFPVALPKFALMWLCTFGLYGCYWFYKNWQYVQRRDGSSIMPRVRGVLHPLWYYPLYAELRRDNARRDPGRSHLPPAAAGMALAPAGCALVIVALSGHAVIAVLSALLLALPLVNYINFVNRDNRAALRHNSRWRPGHYLLVLLSAPLLLLLLGSETGLTPGMKIVEGKTLLSHNLQFLQRRGIVRPGDAIRYFYSDSLLGIRDGGNGFSDRHVFSYWRDDGQFFLESATFDEIKDINVVRGDWNTDTVIEIVRRDDSRFALYAAAIGGRDELFVNSLLEGWRQPRVTLKE